jgi:hypothetical protein
MFRCSLAPCRGVGEGGSRGRSGLIDGSTVAAVYPLLKAGSKKRVQQVFVVTSGVSINQERLEAQQEPPH